MDQRIDDLDGTCYEGKSELLRVSLCQEEWSGPLTPLEASLEAELGAEWTGLI